ncbi:MAG: hypothetical protein JWQ87_2259 [Candidatus Sulfotelmatobacter sp.]|nr:hypothetical protein [Candidatus Sulfotelmatobacter sp.]
MRKILLTYSALFLITLVFAFMGAAHCQVSVAPAPPIHMQFLNATGEPLSGGFLYTYAASSSTPLPTYVDSAGLIQNANPIPLDSTGAPSNGSVEVGIYLANQSYKFVATNSFGVQQWTQDGVSSYLGILNLSNVWTFPQTFSALTSMTLIDNQMAMGVAGNQTTLDFPPPIGNIALHFPNTADTMVGRATTDTLSNKSLVAPSVTGGLTVSSGTTEVDGPFNAFSTGQFSGLLWALAPLRLGSHLIQQSTNTIAGVCTFAAATTCSVVFGSAYTSAPLVFLQPLSPGGVTFTLTAESTTGFTITGSGSNSVAVNWLAIGNPN